jgi:hypothetical protein
MRRASLALIAGRAGRPRPAGDRAGPGNLSQQKREMAKATKGMRYKKLKKSSKLSKQTSRRRVSINY